MSSADINMAPNKPVADGGWGWIVLIAAFIAQVIYTGTLFNVGIYMVEWRQAFSVGAGAVSVVATVMTCALNIASKPPFTQMKLGNHTVWESPCIQRRWGGGGGGGSRWAVTPNENIGVANKSFCPPPN